MENKVIPPVKLKKVWYLTVAILIAILFSTQNVCAKMLALSPSSIIQSSDLIITGTIIDENISSTKTTSTVSVERVFKGRTAGKQIQLTTDSAAEIDRIPIIMPPKGTKVMLLLHQGQLTADFNCIAIVNGSKVQLVSGNSYNQWTVHDYENEYSKLLQNRSYIYIAVAIIVLLISFMVLRYKRKRRENNNSQKVIRGK